MTVGEVCTPSVVTAYASETIAEAARRMRDRHVGTVVVVEEETRRPVGILTDRDIVVGAVAQSPDKLEAMRIGDVMTPQPITVAIDDDIHKALGTMRARGIRRLPVVGSGGRLEGLLSLDDALEVVSDELNDLVELVTRQQKRVRDIRF